jgi:uncharacterized sulfatase
VRIPLSIIALLLLALATRAADRPNILWLTAEDSNPHLGAYGDTFAVTPTLDALAAESVRYTNAFAYTGACSPSRSCLITGVYPMRLGTHHMRSTIPLPPEIKPFPAYLRAAGYYTSNNAKQDYQFITPPDTWDESSNRAHWRKRAPGQPFFSVFNFTVTHQSQIFAPESRYQANTRRLTPAQRRDPARVPIPPIHPDTPEFRREWARHYENVTAMDYLVGDTLAELEEDGLAEDTILTALDDSSPDVRITAAETLARLGVVDRALPVLDAALQLDNVFVRLAALNAALRLGPAARPLLPAIRAAKISAPAQKDTADYVGRMVEYLPARLGH